MRREEIGGIFINEERSAFKISGKKEGVYSKYSLGKRRSYETSYNPLHVSHFIEQNFPWNAREIENLLGTKLLSRRNFFRALVNSPDLWLRWCKSYYGRR